MYGVFITAPLKGQRLEFIVGLEANKVWHIVPFFPLGGIKYRRIISSDLSLGSFKKYADGR